MGRIFTCGLRGDLAQLHPILQYRFGIRQVEMVMASGGTIILSATDRGLPHG